MVEAVRTRSGGDRCPGALRLHEAADGPLARLRVPGGLLTARSTRGLCDAAEAYAEAAVHVTVRGNVEVRAVREPGAFAAAVTAAGLLPSVTHERVRNVLASPLAGLDGHGHAGSDGLVGLVRALDAALVGRPELAALSGRFLFGLDDGRGDVLAAAPDLGVVLLRPGRARFVVAGAAADLGLHPGRAPAALAAAAAASLRACRARHRSVWRLHELGDDLSAVRAEAVAAAADAAGESARPASGDDAVPSAAGGAVTGPGRPGLVRRPPTVDGPGAVACVALLPLGAAPVAAWRVLAEAAQDGDGLIRTTPARGVVVAGLASGRGRRALASLDEAGLVCDPGDPWVGVSACAGTSGCGRALADVRADAAAARRGIPHARPVHWSGCERRCGHPSGSHVEVVATGSGYATTTVGEMR